MKLHGSKPVFRMDDFAKTSPAFGYSTKLNKIVFKNNEAFWMCVIAAQKQGMMSDVPFEYDDDFLKYMIKSTGKKQPTKKDIQEFLQIELYKAMNINDQVEDGQHYKMFRVDGENPNDLSKAQAIMSKTAKQLDKEKLSHEVDVNNS